MTTTTHTDGDKQHHTHLGSVICAIDASRHDPETVRQAALLAGEDGALEIVCVNHTGGVGATATATITPARAEAAVESARQWSADLGVAASARVIHARAPWPAIAEATAGHDLLVVGAHAGSRAEGILIGSVATEALHRSELPVLIARRAPASFPQQIVVATDGSPDSIRAAELAAELATRQETSVTLLTVGTAEDREHRQALALQAVTLFEGAGQEPVIVTLNGMPRTALVRYVSREVPSLLILGSAGKSGVRALGSVSEHVAHHVPCSVLVARRPPAR